MRIAIDSRFLLPHLEGFGRFTREVARRLIQAYPETQFDLLFDRKPLPQYHFGPNQASRILPPQTRHWSLYELWWRFSVPLYLHRYRPQALFATYGQLSPAAARKVPIVAFIHDVAFARYPEHLPRSWYTYYMRTTRNTVRYASLLIVNSRSVQQDLQELFGVSPEKMRLAYSGCDVERFQPLSPEVQPAIRTRYTQGCPYLLYVGSLHPRKNPLRLLQAYDLLRARYTEPLRLVIVGRFMFGKGSFYEAYQHMRHKEEVIFLSRLPDEALVSLYGAAAAVVYPSLYEGFGSPVAEALACGVPVVTSSVSSLPEVGGEAAFYANPYDPADIARALYEALTEPEAQRQARIQKGLAHVRRFSWEACVQTIWQALSEVAA
ncbi:MAG: glycosyltransferase family 4 protein [Bacteroidia bacterium]|jgi:glycosyltransferase involved in cell wall biosynthesis|nr:glycosyltransferase family 4 protein [Bacteroidia bacterium]GIV23706.1 MAG: glycosyl transferase family 1 [Bacteroidia bacterium]